jgi:hypothetical protein
MTKSVLQFFLRTQIDQKMLPFYNKIVAHLTDHGNAHFDPTQQLTNNPTALV